MRMKDVVAVLAGVVVGMSGVFVAAGEARASSGAQAVLWPDRQVAYGSTQEGCHRQVCRCAYRGDAVTMR